MRRTRRVSPSRPRTTAEVSTSYMPRGETQGESTPAAMLREVRTVNLPAGPAVRLVGVRIVEPQLSSAALAAALRGTPVVATTAEDVPGRARTSQRSERTSNVTFGGAIVSISGRVGHRSALEAPSARARPAPDAAHLPNDARGARAVRRKDKPHPPGRAPSRVSLHHHVTRRRRSAGPARACSRGSRGCPPRRPDR
jgi:hypothetical protein